MPFVNIRTAKGLMSKEQKAELCERVTDLMVEIEGGGNPEFRGLVWVLVEELEPENWCVGGNQVSEEMIRSLK